MNEKTLLNIDETGKKREIVTDKGEKGKIKEHQQIRGKFSKTLEDSF